MFFREGRGIKGISMEEEHEKGINYRQMRKFLK